MVEAVSSSQSVLAQLHQMRAAATAQSARTAAAAGAQQLTHSGGSQASGISHSAQRELSTFVLQGFLDAALPKDLVGSEGTGTAGAMWRSMLSKELSKVLVESGQLNLLQAKPSVTPESAGIGQWKTQIK